MSTPKTKSLEPRPTEAERERAAEIWTAASDKMVARGYQRHIWGALGWPAQDMVILVIREALREAPDQSRSSASQ